MTTEFKGTKGEWIISWRNSDLVEVKSLESINKPICELDSYYFSKRVFNYQELEANAKLIAAAPELLEALIECLDATKELNDEHQDGWDDTIEKAERVINKALK